MYQNFKISKYTYKNIHLTLLHFNLQNIFWSYIALNMINRINITASYSLTIVTTNDIILQVTTKCNTLTAER